MRDQHMAELRRDYQVEGIDASTVDRDPFAQFRLWMEDAIGAGLPEPNAMVLATVGPDGRPRSRAVLLKGFSDGGFVFFTNTESVKGEHIARNPNVSLLFVWLPLFRQVRVQGRAEPVTSDESDAYFATRPVAARISAWASDQSRPIPDRAWLEDRAVRFRARYPDEDVPRPDHWGGYVVVPEEFEFWQGRPDRLHDRIRYLHDATTWAIDRLSP